MTGRKKPYNAYLSAAHRVAFSTLNGTLPFYLEMSVKMKGFHLPNQATKRCQELSLNFSRIFRYQYLITQKQNQDIDMSSQTIGDWTVFFGSALHVARIKDKNGIDLAMVLGIGVDQQGLLKDQQLVDNLDVTAPLFFDEFDLWLKYLAGRYTIILHAKNQTRVYADPVGMNGVVYDPVSRQVAASTFLALDRPLIDHPLYDHKVIKEGGKYSLFHTRDVYVRRMNPNAYLDLSNFSETRFWPRGEIFESTPEDWPGYYDEMVCATKHVTKCIVENFQTALPLSGGRDSRLMLAMAGEEIKSIPQVFTHIPNYASRIDANVAREITTQLGIRHEVYDKREIKIQKKRKLVSELEFQTASGVDAPQPQELRLGLNVSLTDGAVILRGHQTDLLRAVFVHRTNLRSKTNFRWQVKLMNIVPLEKFDDEVMSRFAPEYISWYEQLPANAKRKSVDFAFLEIYYSSTLGTTFPGIHRNFYLSPFNSRRMIELSLSIEDNYRRSGYPVMDIIFRENPTLHDIPFGFEIMGEKLNLDVFEDTKRLSAISADRNSKTRKRVERMTSMCHIPEGSTVVS